MAALLRAGQPRPRLYKPGSGLTRPGPALPWPGLPNPLRTLTVTIEILHPLSKFGLPGRYLQSRFENSSWRDWWVVGTAYVGKVGISGLGVRV